MAAAAEKLQPIESTEERELKLPDLPKGDVEVSALAFAQPVRFLSGLGTQLMLGRNFNDFDITGQVTRIAVRPNGTAYALVRVGGRSDSSGMKIMGGKFREIVFFPNGMYGAVKE